MRAIFASDVRIAKAGHFQPILILKLLHAFFLLGCLTAFLAFFVCLILYFGVAPRGLHFATLPYSFLLLLLLRFLLPFRLLFFFFNQH